MEKIILLQSVIRGMLLRIKISNQPLTQTTFLPPYEPDLPYIIPQKSLITEEEIKYLYSNFEPVKDGIDIINLKTIQYVNGSQYYGGWIKNNNQRHGLGILKYQGGPCYYGQFKMDKAEGKGKVIFRKDEEYIGDWIDNKANGFGIYRNNKVKYEGKWKDDKQHGIGTETWENGNCYTGEFNEGKKCGKGKFRRADGSTYTGTFWNNCFHGKGHYIFKDGREYNGEWKCNMIEGEGVFKWSDGRKYIGKYKADKKDGYGIFEWPNGSKYKGYWKKGKQQGEGEFYNPKKKIWVKSFWQNGRKENLNPNNDTVPE